MTIWAVLGFLLASYAVIGNDSVQTLGTFLASNSKKKWVLLWAFAASILTAVLVYGWFAHGGDVSYGRLNKFEAVTVEWWHLIPMFGLLVMTRLGMPVSTTFMALSVFSTGFILEKIIMKSLLGYGVAFLSSFVIWIGLSYLIEKKVFEKPLDSGTKKNIWTCFQWASTGFLWSQWLIQDLANIYIFLPRPISPLTLVLSLVFMLSLLAYIIQSKGGKIQNIVKSKTNTLDVRAATCIDFCYALVLLYFKKMNSIPMSTTWVFLGILAGREVMIHSLLKKRNLTFVLKNLGSDLAKASAGLIISVSLAYLVQSLFG